MVSSSATKRPSPCAQGISAVLASIFSPRVHTQRVFVGISMVVHTSLKRAVAFCASATVGSPGTSLHGSPAAGPGSSPACTAIWNPLHGVIMGTPRSIAAASAG